jgi:hypothetical protein
MKFTPKTEKELAEQGLLPKGTYPFEVADALEKVSTKGNDMIVVHLIVYADDGSSRKLTDYLMESVAFKLHSFCKSTGLLPKYSEGNFGAEDCLGRSGYVNIAIEPAKPKEDGNGEWPAKNKVASYASGAEKAASGAVPSVTKPAPTEREQANQSDTDSSDVPF